MWRGGGRRGQRAFVRLMRQSRLKTVTATYKAGTKARSVHEPKEGGTLPVTRAACAASRAPRCAAPHGAALGRAHLPPLPLLFSGTRSCSTRLLAVSSTLRAGANVRAPVGAAGSTLATMTLSGSRGWGRLRVQLDVCAPGGALVSLWQWLRVTAHDRHGLPVGALPGPRDARAAWPCGARPSCPCRTVTAAFAWDSVTRNTRRACRKNQRADVLALRSSG